jgi:hypothetical protein
VSARDDAIEALHTPVEVHEYDDTNGVFVTDEAGDHVVTCLLCAECTTDGVLEALGDCDWREGDGVEFPCSTIEAIRGHR